jgi:Xaa-Pro aminopeptidase
MKDGRIAKVLNIMGSKALDACIIRGMDNIYYLTGFRGSEGTLFVTTGDVALITDFRYITHAKEVTKGVKIEEQRGKQNVVSELCEKYGIKKMGFDSFHTFYQMHKRWVETLKDVELVPLESDIEEIRKCKEPEEIEAIRKAIDISTNAFVEVFEKIRPGKTEKEIARDLDFAMRSMGADSPSFDTIVASGPRAALPHAVPTDREIKAGEAIIMDFGAQLNGYCSDETCTIAVGDVNGKIREIHKIVSDAKDLAIEKIRSGMSIKDLDTIVRGFIDEAGYGEYFRHGVGHGIGIAVHEAPSITSVGEGVLEEDMVVTIEPGIYLPNLGGVRLEDMVLITDKGATVLTRLRKELLNISA